MPGTAMAELEAFLQQPPPNWNPPSSLVANNPMAIAHAGLEYLRESGDDQFLLVRVVLELAARQQQQQQQLLSGHEEELLFHCVTGCRQVTLWHYKTKLSTRFIQTLRDCMMMFGFEPAFRRHRTVQMACFTTSAALWKRGWNALDQNGNSSDASGETQMSENDEEDRDPTPEEERLIQGMVHLTNSSLDNSTWAPLVISKLRKSDNLFHCMERLFQSQAPHLVEGSALFLQALVTEFVGRSAVSYRLPLEYHKQTHRTFQKDGALTTITSLALTSLGHILTVLANDGTQHQHSFETSASVALAVVQLTSECLGWEFGLAAWDFGKLGASSTSSGKASLRLPVEWSSVLHPIPLVKALVHVILKLHQINPSTRTSPLAHSLRQLLLSLATLTGPIFPNAQERQQYASILLDGTLQLIQRVDTQEENTYLIDVLQLLGRLVANFRLSVLVDLASLLNPLLQTMASIGQKLLQDQTQECERVGGDLEEMNLREWREEALAVLLMDCAVMLASDPWIMYSGTESTRRQAQRHLASLILGPLYRGMVECRTRMAALEEHFLVSQETQLDETREEIMAFDLEDELEAISAVGRLHLESALACLAERHGQIMPGLQAIWGEAGQQSTVTAEIAGLLEEARLWTMYVSYLLTDDNQGESPEIPLAVLQACQEEFDLQQQPSSSVTASIVSAVQALIQFAEAQMQRVAANPSNLRLSPMLAKTFLQFFQRWAPAYIYPGNHGSSSAGNPILEAWSQPAKAHQSVSFCLTLALYYQCYWPLERIVQDEANKLLLAMVKRGGRLRHAVVASPVFVEMVKFHCVTAGICHVISSEQDFENIVRSKFEGSSIMTNTSSTSWAMSRGYQRLSYDDRAQTLATIMIACSDSSDAASSSLLNESLKVIHASFISLTQTLDKGGASASDLNTKELTCLCLAMLYGVTNASEMNESERIPHFLTPLLPPLAGLMSHCEADLTVCESLLRLFQNYAAQFVVVLNKEQSLILFQASADLLKSYSKHHCANRVIRKSNAEAEAEEEQAYNDILCAIQLLVNLGAKDFIDACNTTGGEGVDSGQVTDMIFFGLQQLLPLMTQGLLQFPTLCTQFFELVGFMMDTYPEKVCQLPFDVFNPLLHALLFGMSHHDVNVARPSLRGLSSIAREHVENHALQPIMTQHAPDLLDQCLSRLFSDVIFRPVIMDRIEPTGAALLVMAAADGARLSIAMTQICEMTYQRDNRLKEALSALLTSERLSKVVATGYEGRMNVVLFKEEFQNFVTKIQSFMMIR
ncbi:hypothetical protein ACA910_000584 [Epithemia clementina (nom. ined.)]